MKIGIVTFHNVYNYGGMLQAFALCHFLQETYSACYCIDYRQDALTKKYRHRLWDKEKSVKQNTKHFIAYYLLRKNYEKEKKFNAFLSRHIPQTKAVSSLEAFQDVTKDFDILISGSDQLWNPQFTGGQLDPVYFLETNTTVRKYAYASSAGARIFNPSEIRQIQQYLQGYHSVAVREDFLKQQLLPVRHDVEVVLDPTLLLDRAKWLSLRQHIGGLPPRFVLLYTFDNDAKTIAIAKRVSQQLRIPIVSLFRVKTKLQIEYTRDDLGPQEFLDLLDKCSFVVTNSFHGTAFSINFQKDFFSVYKTSNPHRVLNLVGQLGLSERVVKNSEELPEPSGWKIDYAEPMQALHVQRTKAKEFLTF